MSPPKAKRMGVLAINIVQMALRQPNIVYRVNGFFENFLRCLVFGFIFLPDKVVTSQFELA